MTTKQIAFLIGTGCVLALGACDRNEIEPADNSKDLRTRELPAEVSVRERAAAEERAEQRGAEVSERDKPATNAMDERRAEVRDTTGTSDPASTRSATSETMAQNATPRRDEAELETIGDAQLDAKAVFEERADGVAVLVNVEDAKPGTRSVRIYDQESCDDIEEKGLGKPLEAAIKHGNLGSVTIGPSGKGTLETKAPSSSSLFRRSICVSRPTAARRICSRPARWSRRRVPMRRCRRSGSSSSRPPAQSKSRRSGNGASLAVPRRSCRSGGFRGVPPRCGPC